MKTFEVFGTRNKDKGFLSLITSLKKMWKFDIVANKAFACILPIPANTIFQLYNWMHKQVTTAIGIKSNHKFAEYKYTYRAQTIKEEH